MWFSFVRDFHPWNPAHITMCPGCSGIWSILLRLGRTANPVLDMLSRVVETGSLMGL
jgi:hypothetical protein